MINLYLKGEGGILKDVGVEKLESINPADILWVDACMPSVDDRKALEKALEVTLVSKEEAQEIESTSKYIENEDGVVANMNFYEPAGETFRMEPMSFIVSKNDYLVSMRHTQCDVFSETEKRILHDYMGNRSGTEVFFTLIESHIDREADMLELVAKHITELSRDISSNDSVEKEMVKRISELQEKIMSLRESIFDCQRVLFSIRRSSRFPASFAPRVQLILKDVDSLINHADFSFQRLDSLQDTAMGLINIEQNEIVKILSVAAVIFMPPTLVASIYGMNFKAMPQLDWTYQMAGGTIIPLGYISAIVLMIALTLLTLWYFKYKKWL